MLRPIRSIAMANLAEFNVIKEGKATILAPKEDKVFYNPIQQFNRDLSMICAQTWLQQWKDTSKKRKGAKRPKISEENDFVRVLEALSATGLRAIRYAHEVPQVQKVVANDLLADAVKLIKRSAEHNGLADKVLGHQGDAIRYMALVGGNEKFHIVDLDPYGTAAPFLDSAVQLVVDGGLLMVTCTDAGVLVGTGYPEKCFALYGGNNFGSTTMGSDANHEAGVRLLLGSIASSAARHKRSVEPILSLSIDYYLRVFVRVTTSPIAVKDVMVNTMLVYHCVGCGHRVEQRFGRASPNKYHYPRIAHVLEFCPHCSLPYHVAGPMWGGRMHCGEFLDAALKQAEKADEEVYGTKLRVVGMLTLAQQELEEPFYVLLNQLLSIFRTPPISLGAFSKAMGNLGHRVSLTHCKRNMMKTLAPWEVVLGVFKGWLRTSNERLVKEYTAKIEKGEGKKVEEKLAALRRDMGRSPNLTEGMVGWKVLDRLGELEVDFDTENDQSRAVERLRRLKIVKFQENPTLNWGPKSRPKA